MMTCKLIVIGSSLGGSKALQKLLLPLLGCCTIPTILVQHRDADVRTDDMLSRMLQKSANANLSEAEDHAFIESGHVYLAPADYHLLVENNRLVLSTEQPVAHARPSIDVTFDTAARSYGPSVTGVILTGTGSDGAAGLAEIERRGGGVVVQDPKEAEQSGMPKAAIAATRSPKVMPLEEIVSFLCALDPGNNTRECGDGSNGYQI
jgi:two-component system, chemotaxis family, protein-glutamate methylesterase/glutaminase